MKKYISVFEMITRSTVYKVLLVLAIMAAVQLSLFWGKLEEFVVNMEYSFDHRIELIVDQSYMILPLAAGFLLITVILCWSGCNIGSNQGYTLRRLQIPEMHVLVLQAVYNGMVYILLWASQVVIMLVANYWYMQQDFETTNQSIVLAFYKNAYMHTILPMKDGFGWFLLVVMILACGIATAVFPYQQRRGTIGFSVIAVVGTVFILFPRGMGSDMSFLIFYPILLLVTYGIYTLIINAIRGEKKDE